MTIASDYTREIDYIFINAAIPKNSLGWLLQKRGWQLAAGGTGGTYSTSGSGKKSARKKPALDLFPDEEED